MQPHPDGLRTGNPRRGRGGRRIMACKYTDNNARDYCKGAPVRGALLMAFPCLMSGQMRFRSAVCFRARKEISSEQSFAEFKSAAGIKTLLTSTTFVVIRVISVWGAGTRAKHHCRASKKKTRSVLNGQIESEPKKNDDLTWALFSHFQPEDTGRNTTLCRTYTVIHMLTLRQSRSQNEFFLKGLRLFGYWILRYVKSSL